MKRRTLSLGGIVLALILGIIAVAMLLERRPNPILVTFGSSVRFGRAGPAVVELSTGNEDSSVEVEVARARPIPMAITDALSRGPGGTSFFMPMADPAAVSVEMKELRAALESWAAAPGRDLEVLDVSSSEEMSTWFFRTRQKVRVVLHARLGPKSARARPAPAVR